MKEKKPMELDFSWIETLKQQQAQKDFTEPQNANEGKEIPEGEKAPSGADRAVTEALNGRGMVRLKQMQEEYSRSAAEKEEAQKKRLRTELLETKILKGVRAGDPPLDLFLKAVECISLLKNNSLFYDQINNDLRAIWGEGFQDPIPLEWELKDLQKRLERLELALGRSDLDREGKDRIEKAIKAHRDREKDLEKRIREAEKAGA